MGTRSIGRYIALVLLFTLTVGVAAQTRVTVSTGHTGPVLDIAGRPDLDLAFSVGDDGKLLVWNLGHRGLYRGLYRAHQISHFPVSRVALHPSRTEAVLYVQEGVRRGRLVGFDWESGEELFEVRLDARPNYLAYSPKGTFIVYTVANFDSITFLDAEDGSRRDYLDEAFGAVTFVQMARSERNVMTYIPSRGEFIYWQIESGDELQTVPTVSRLEHVTIIDESTQRFLAGSDGDQLVVVDNLTGQTRATYPVKPIHDIIYDAENERILVLSEQVGRRTTLAFTYSSGRLRRDFYRPQNLSESTRALAVAGSQSARGFLAGSETGEIAFFEPRNGRRTILGPDALTPVADLAFTNGRLHLALDRGILSLVSDLFESEPGDPIRLGFVRDSMTDLPDFSDLAIEAVPQPDAERLLIWGGDQPGSIWQLVPPAGEPQLLYDDPLDVPIRHVASSSAGPLVVHRDGRVIQVDHETGIERFRYTTVGTQDALWDPQLGLIVAKTRSSSFDSSVIVVDQLTQETVAADTEAFLTARIALDDRTDTLYAIGLYGSQSSPSTRLTQLSGRGFRTSTALAESPMELSRGDLLWDTVTQTLFSTMEYEAVRTYRGGRQGSLERVDRLHADITVGSHFLMARNVDGTVTFWDRRNGEHLVDLYVFGDEWIAIGLEGRFLASSKSAERYLTLIPAPGTTLELDDFRLQPPFGWPLD